MYHYRQELSSSSKPLLPSRLQMNSEAFSARFVPPTQKEVISKLLKANVASSLDEPKFSVSSQVNAAKKKRTTSKTIRSKASKFEGPTHVSLLEDSRKLKALEPSVKSLVRANNSVNSSSFRRLKTKPALESHHRTHHKGSKQKELSPVVPIPLQMTPTILHGEKLITVGGYIISLQPHMNGNVHCVVRPKVSSDMDGLELEIKIDGCAPNEIKVEKRYETLIVIGCSKNVITDNANYDTNNQKENKAKLLDSKQLTLKNLQALMKGHADDVDSFLDVPKDHLDRLRELVNVFVPKGINLKDVHISRPDAFGKFILKGP